jgi:hypothetical protein
MHKIVVQNKVIIRNLRWCQLWFRHTGNTFMSIHVPRWA